jgi:hypothetical protein
MNNDSRLSRDPANQCQKVVTSQGDTAGGRRQAWAGDVDEHGAAATGNPGPRVVIEFEKNVVEGVVAPEAVAWFIGRPPERAVIAPISRIFTPGVGGADPAKGERCPRARKAIGPPP